MKLRPGPGFSERSNYSVTLGSGFDKDTNVPNTLRNIGTGGTQETQFCSIIYVSMYLLLCFSGVISC